MYNSHNTNLKRNAHTNRTIITNRLIVFIVLILSCTYGNDAFSKRVAKEKVVLQLKWKSQFQFAGYYAALEKGYYKEAGFDVEIKELDKSTSSIEEVLSGKAQYGVGNSELVIHYLKGSPIIVLACILQNSPSALMVKTSSNITTLNDLIGKTIEIDKDQSGIEILAMLAQNGIKPNQYQTTPSSFSLNNLLANKVDAQEVYTSNEPFFLDKFGIPYRLIYPRNFGINFYSDCLFTTQDELKSHPDRVKNFRLASLKGWKYALENPEEIANLIQTKHQSTKTLDHLLYEAEEMRKLINPEFIEIGHNNKERWMNIVEILSQQGLVKQYKDLNGFIYNPDEYSNSVNKKVLTAIIAGLVLIIISLIYYVLKLKSSLIIDSSRALKIKEKNNRLMDEVVRLNTELDKIKVKN